jgi:hypothetical protein
MPLTEQDEAVTHQQERTEWRRKQEIGLLRKVIEYFAEMPWGDAMIYYQDRRDEEEESKQRENNR